MIMKGSSEYERFTTLLDGVLAVPHSAIQERIEKHREKVKKNPNKPGPKPKAKSSSA